VHLCWGNYEGPHHLDIELEKIFDDVMRLKASALQFEASNPRHAHEWAVWRANADKIPDDKVLIPGVLDTTANYIEHPALVAERPGAAHVGQRAARAAPGGSPRRASSPLYEGGVGCQVGLWGSVVLLWLVPVVERVLISLSRPRAGGRGMTRSDGNVAAVAHLDEGRLGGQRERGACRSEALVAGEHLPDRFGQGPGELDLGDLRAALAAHA